MQSFPYSSFHPPQPVPLIPVGLDILAETRAIGLGIHFLLFRPPFVAFLGWLPDRLTSFLFAKDVFLISQFDQCDLKTT